VNTPQQRKPADFDELYPGRFLKAGQLGERKPTVTILSVELDELVGENGQPKMKGVIAFREIKYQLALNKTNGELLKAMFGRDLNKWPGRRLTLYQGKVEHGSWKGQPAIRIWGSPELDADKTVSVQLPRKRPLQFVLHAVQSRDAARKPEVERHPTEQTPPQTSGDEGEAPPFGDGEQGGDGGP
jgi:hypothetical protein